MIFDLGLANARGDFNDNFKDKQASGFFTMLERESTSIAILRLDPITNAYIARFHETWINGHGIPVFGQKYTDNKQAYTDKAKKAQ